MAIWKNPFRSIRVSIANQLRYGLVLLVAVSLLSTGGILIYSSFRTQLKQSNRLQQARSQTAAEQINAYMDDLQRKLGYLARVRGLSSLPVETQQTLIEGLIRHNDAYEVVAIVNRQGEPVAVVSPYGEVKMGNLASSPLFIRAFKRSEDSVDTVSIDPKIQRLVTTIAVPIRNEKDEVDGVLLAKVNLRFLDFVLSQTEVGATGYTYAIDNRNVLIAKQRSANEPLALQDISDRPFIKALTDLDTDLQPVTVYRGLKDEEVLGAIAPVRSVGWAVIVELPTAEAYAPIRNLIWTMAGALTLATGVTVGVGFLFARRIVKPLQQLTAAAEQIRSGNLDTHVEIQAQNELGVLATTFNQMSSELSELYHSLEQKVAERTAELQHEKERSEQLLLNILPEAIANRLKLDPTSIADSFAEVSIIFADIVGFTDMSSRISPVDLVGVLNQIFSVFDRLADQHGLEKIKTIGDAYMVVGGLPTPRDDHAEAIADMALDMLKAIDDFNMNSNFPELSGNLSMRIGINTGAVVAGVIGVNKFIYDLWGDTVNIASRMESHGLAGNIQVTEATYLRLKDKYQLEERGAIAIKGRGEMLTFWLKGRKD
ncbi:adenylate/guanylate cyclase domain-containing protein [Tumidithrix elongata RA019]|uniref:Adenylate cyclase n=1 Tax=Tumidithrix elongata BACA0141 TaxID=2716417 RepID=A0AAW9Q4M4_9CYAN|nr:adenylate/guanylate cyclase domain-containing protein [Tumidithrix elongata RA019]